MGRIKGRLVCYLSHPIWEDKDYTLEQNLDHALKVCGILHRVGYEVTIPWLIVLYINPNKSLDLYRFSLLRRWQAAQHQCLILAGHKMKPHMREERDIVLNNDGLVLNFINIKDKNLEEIASRHLTQTYR